MTPKVLYKTFWFKGEEEGATKSAIPVWTSTEKMGVVLSVSGTRETEEAVFESHNGSNWYDSDAVNQRDRVTLTITCGELTQKFIELIEMMTAGTGYGKTLVVNRGTPGNNHTTKGWMRLESVDDAGDLVHATERWVKLDVQSWEFPQTGYAQCTFTVRYLYNALQNADFIDGL